MRLLVMIFALSMTAVNTQAAQTLFQFKKSLNPKNVLNYSVEMSSNCSLLQVGGSYIEPFWIMGESDGHREGLTNKEKKIFTPLVSYINSAKTELDFNVAAVDLVKKQIPHPEITVRTNLGKTCSAKAFMQIDNEEIELSEIFISGSITWSLDWKTDYLIISGKKADGTSFKKKIVP
ncbi:MAG: DUF4833 domain-containing protein [Bacteriovoracaceae bacterium]